MPVPPEFAPEAVAAASPRGAQLYKGIPGFREPFTSLLANNPWMRPPDPRKPLVWGPPPQFGRERYWDTTVGRKHEYWKDFDLPQPTKDLRRLRHDFLEWGYCLIEDGLSQEQYHRMKKRLLEQAEGEKLAGIQFDNGPGQYVMTLVNKGECFVQCIEQDPEGVQAGPVIEQLLNETLGQGWICTSFLANGCDPGGYPQNLHQDTNGENGPFRAHYEAPTLVNTAYVLEDTNEFNGGTIMIPGSHKILAEAKCEPVQHMPPPINLEAKGGTVVMWDGRLLHAAGANRSGGRRYVCTASSIKPWFRSQEMWALSVKREVLEKASPKLLQRMGFQATAAAGTADSFGFQGNGLIGDLAGQTIAYRLALDNGNHRPVTELAPTMSREQLEQDFTLRHLRERARAYLKARSARSSKAVAVDAAAKAGAPSSRL
uniref:Fe2OG dioxygenase domain-containing protein n=1 Tax=Alexandrium monilatum TaxID=311494 RepID=A0A7S4PVE6_9DINO